MRLPVQWTNLLLVACLSLMFIAFLFAQSPRKDSAGQTPHGGSSTLGNAALDRGRAVYKRSCAICHFETSTAKKVGPGMKGIYKRGTYADGKPVDDASMRVWIEKGGKDMPGLKDSLKPEQVSDLIAYLKTL